MIGIDEDMANENQEQTVKHSDFSIDHILNRAGNSNRCGMSCERVGTYDRVSENVEKFQWLQCSRYCPPKVPRLHKRDVQKRQLGRHPRIPFTSYQLSVLEQQFKESPYLSSEEVTLLSKKLQLADIRVKIWFQNRRARERREKNGLVSESKCRERNGSSSSDLGDYSVISNRLCNDTERQNSTVTSQSRSRGSPDKSLVVKTEVNSSAIDFSSNSVVSITNMSDMLESNCMSSPYFLAGSMPIFIPHINLMNNKNVEL